MIDSEGYRPNVGIILCNDAEDVFWARRAGEDAWQFPQGGIRPNETPEQALYRELAEEIGLTAADVEILGCTREWLRYRLPQRYLRRRRGPRCIGQKQRWFLLRFIGDEQHVCLTRTDKPEFDRWRWTKYWETVDQVVSFKRKVYRQALDELMPLAGATVGHAVNSRLKHR